MTTEEFSADLNSSATAVADPPQTIASKPLAAWLRKLPEWSLPPPVRPVLFFLFCSAAVLGTYVAFDRLFTKVPCLSETAYFKPVITLQLHKNSSVLWTLPLLAVPFVCYRRLRWSSFEQGSLLRYFILFVVLVLAWSFSTYDYNYYYNQTHLADRLLLVVLALLVWLHPAFLPLFMLLLSTIMFQFDYPLGHTTWNDKLVPLRFVVLFIGFLYLRCLGLFQRQFLAYFVFFALCLHGAHYFFPGYTKLYLDWRWFYHDELSCLMAAGFQNGWLRVLSPEAKQLMIDSCNSLNVLFLALTLAVELSGILLLVNRRLTLVLLAGCAALHFGIFVSSGVFFWKWMLLNLGLIVFLSKLKPEHFRLPIAPRLTVVLSVLVIALAPFYFDPSWLGWRNSRLCTCFELEAVGESGQTYPVSRWFMGPYDVRFTQSRFWYLSQDPTLTGTYGVVKDVAAADALMNVRTLDEVAQLEADRGEVLFNDTKAGAFDRFIKTYFQNVNAHPKRRTWHQALSAPHHIWTHRFPDDFQSQERITKVRVRQVKEYFDGRESHRLEDKVIRTIEIP